jgi:flagellar biosynthesis protein FlhB
VAARGEPTEAPTPRRLREARRRGEVATSGELTSAAGAAAAVAALAFGGPALVHGLSAYLRAALQAAPAAGDGVDVAAALGGGLAAGGHALALPLAAAAAAALAVGLAQTRGLFAPAAARADLGRLSPAAAWRRLGSGRALWDAGRGLCAVAVVAAVVWLTVRPALGGLAALTGAAPARVLAALGALGRAVAVRAALAALALGALDYLVRARAHRRDLRMTREEVRRERRETEGDPATRAERRARAAH